MILFPMLLFKGVADNALFFPCCDVYVVFSVLVFRSVAVHVFLSSCCKIVVFLWVVFSMLLLSRITFFIMFSYNSKQVQLLSTKFDYTCFQPSNYWYPYTCMGSTCIPWVLSGTEVFRVLLICTFSEKEMETLVYNFVFRLWYRRGWCECSSLFLARPWFDWAGRGKW